MRQHKSGLDVTDFKGKSLIQNESSKCGRFFTKIILFSIKNLETKPTGSKPKAPLSSTHTANREYKVRVWC